MAYARTSSEVPTKTPHSVSLKVLRLSKPSLSQQTPLPRSNPSSTFKINPLAALATKSDHFDPHFILSPLLTLPSSFGTLHVGETFTCTLCINNELSADVEDGPSITQAQISAEMSTPSSIDPISLELDGGAEEASDAAVDLASGETLQRIMRYYLREEGNHVLTVTVTYTESLSGGTEGGGVSRVRTFRKLYQFAAQSLMGIRTKIRTLPVKISSMPINSGKASFALEAQLENYSDGTIVLEDVEVLPRDGLQSKTLNAWEMASHKEQELAAKPTILPGDVLQVAYVLGEGTETAEDQMAKMRREAVGLCQLHVRWRATMGEEGALTTAWLGGKRR